MAKTKTTGRNEDNKIDASESKLQLEDEKPMFLAEDLDLESKDKFRSDEARELNDKIDKLYQGD